MKIKKGDKIKADYEGKLDNGEVFDSSTHGDHSHPIEFTVGEGQVIKGFDDAVVGMEKGEEKEFTIKSEGAYGERKEELKQKIPRDKLPQDQDPKEGMVLMIGNPETGQQFPTKILAVDDKEVTIDMNHPLAGKDLTFKIKIVSVESA
tara:strand:+ start:966 stop:1409 length:444 start_codon:yes stop_codon:yes gene_type:complete